jgi:hypothetical protein
MHLGLILGLLNDSGALIAGHEDLLLSQSILGFLFEIFLEIGVIHVEHVLLFDPKEV